MGNSSDENHQYRFVAGKRSGRHYTLDALFESVLNQFVMETAGRADIFADLDTVEKQKAALQETADYVITTESLRLSKEENDWLIDLLHQDLFRFGPLDGLFDDDTVTEVNINAPDKLFKRHGYGELEPLSGRFRSANHLTQILQRILSPLGIDLEAGDGFLEAGLLFAGRPIRISMIGPPMMPYYQGHIRLHPHTPRRLDDLSEAIPPVAGEMLASIVQHGHGLLIVGDNNSGKTTLYASLFEQLPLNASTALLERAAEIHPDLIPEHVQRYLTAENPSFDVQIEEALQNGEHAVFLMDEIRGDEQGAFWRVLTNAQVTQVITAFRGRGGASRLHSGISMAIRKANRSLPQTDIDNVLQEKLPFVVVLSHPAPDLPPRLMMLGQWVPDESGLTLEPLIEWLHKQAPVRTDAVPRHEIEG